MNLTYSHPSGSSVVIKTAKVTRFVTENMFEGESFNRSGQKHTIEGTGILDSINTIAEKIGIIQQILNKPRGSISVDWNGGNSNVTLHSYSDDARNGPLPNCTATEIIGNLGTSTIIIGFSFVYFTCAENRVQRFEMSIRQSIDQAGFVTMIKEGFLSLSTAGADGGGMIGSINGNPIFPSAATVQSADAGPNPDLYRNLVCGAPPVNFVRVRQDYAIDSSLRTLMFQVEDRMSFRELKSPVLMGDASYSYTRSLGNILGTKTFSASFEGDASTYPAELLAIAYEAAQARINFVQVGSAQPDLIQEMTITEPNLYTRNKVELRIVAQGVEDGLLQPSTVKAFWTAMHTTGSTEWASPYPDYSVYLGNIDSLKLDSCLANIVESVPQEGDGDGGKRTVRVSTNSNNDVAVPEGNDTNLGDSALGFDGTIVKYEATTTQDTPDTGLGFLETTGGGFQVPYQNKLPVVTYTQVVKMICTNKNPSIPWQELKDPYIVLNQKIVISDVKINVLGGSYFAIVATRQVQIQVSNSENTIRSGGDESGIKRSIFYNPLLPAPKSPYTSNKSYDASNSEKQNNSATDYIGN